MSSLFISLILGSTLGILYGALYLFSHYKTLAAVTSAATRPRHVLLVFTTITRFLLLASVMYYVLRSMPTHRILVLLSFLPAFWLVVFIVKAKHYGRN